VNYKIAIKYRFLLLLSLCTIFYGNAIFSQHIELNSGWQFALDKTELTSQDWRNINLPHTWNDKDAFDEIKGYKRGVGIYKRQIFFSDKKEGLIHYLHFNGVNQEADVYINDQHIGNHKGGYTAFNFDITRYIRYNSYNLIEVKVDNSHNENIPPLDADFTFYGGIYRTVNLISVPKLHFSISDFASEGFFVNYYNVSDKTAGVEISLKIDNKSIINARSYVEITLSDANHTILEKNSEKIQLKANSTRDLKVKLPEIKNPILWSPENPYLYKLHMVLKDKNGKVLDTKFSDVGFRWVTLDSEKGLFLNGKPYKLIGVNRHQDYEGFGNAVPMHLQENDIKLIKEMGANFIRFAHYPHAQELYKMCDKLGILVWTEIPVVNKITDTEEFFQTSLDMQIEHIKQYYNYPSVIMFGYMNEIFLKLAFDNKTTISDKEIIKKTTVKLAKQLEELTRKHAPGRITVMALHFNETYNETNIADISMLIGWNLYFGWYHDSISDLGIFLDEQHKRFPKRSILVSEYGPGADVRIFTNAPKKYDFSQDYQFLLHNGYYNQVVERDFVVGMSAWNFADFGSEFRGDAIPHVNQKGLVQYDRTPKDIYYWYKSVLNNDTPFVYIATKFIPELTLINQETYPVKIFSNEDQVMVYLNNKLLEKVQVTNGFAIVEVPFKDSENVLTVISETAKDEQIINVSKLMNLKAYNGVGRIGINMGTHFNFNDSENQITWLPDRKYSKGLYGYLNGKVFNINKERNQGVPYDIKNTTAEPLYQTMLEGCTDYKVDIPNGKYKITLFFVEPQIKSNTNLIYNLNKEKEKTSIKKNQRIFNVYLNGSLLLDNFNMAEEYPDKYGISKTFITTIAKEEGVNLKLEPIQGKTVISGLLLERLN